MDKKTLEDVVYLVDNKLIKKDCMFVLSNGRIVCSNDKEMKISHPKNPLRVGELSGNIQINTIVFNKFSRESQIYWLIWGLFRNEVTSEIVADKYAMLESGKLNLHKRNILVEFISFSKEVPSDLNVKRAKAILKTK